VYNHAAMSAADMPRDEVASALEVRREALSPIALVRLAAPEREAFVKEEVANYAAERIRDADWDPSEALSRAATELLPVLERELAEADEGGHDLWSAIRADGVTVGWLWIRPGDQGAGSAFLYQLTVAESFRGMGYGSAMLAALEERLVRGGVEELRLHVNRGNLPARRLYAAAGYEQLGEDRRVLRLSKRLVAR
jgi:ribosomal protein S18 acetylase RimI-like enzyme